MILGLKNMELTENINLRKLIQEWEKKEESSSVEYVTTHFGYYLDCLEPLGLIVLHFYYYYFE